MSFALTMEVDTALGFLVTIDILDLNFSQNTMAVVYKLFIYMSYLSNLKNGGCGKFLVYQGLVLQVNRLGNLFNFFVTRF